MDVRIASYLGTQMAQAVIALQASVYFDEIQQHQQNDLEQSVFVTDLTRNFIRVMEAASPYRNREMSRRLNRSLEFRISQLLSAFHELAQGAQQARNTRPEQWGRFTHDYFRNLDDLIPDSRPTYASSSEPYDDMQRIVQKIMAATDAIVSHLSSEFGDNDSVKLATVLLFRKIETMMLQGIISSGRSNFSSIIKLSTYVSYQFVNELLRFMPAERTLEEVFERFDSVEY